MKRMSVHHYDVNRCIWTISDGLIGIKNINHRDIMTLAKAKTSESRSCNSYQMIINQSIFSIMTYRLEIISLSLRDL